MSRISHLSKSKQSPSSLSKPKAAYASPVDALKHYLAEHTKRVDGCFTSMDVFAKSFIPWLPCPALQLWFCQHSRLRRMLNDQGYPTGYWAPYRTAEFGIGNLWHPGSELASTRRLINEPERMMGEFLLPTDYT